MIETVRVGSNIQTNLLIFVNIHSGQDNKFVTPTGDRLSRIYLFFVRLFLDSSQSILSNNNSYRAYFAFRCFFHWT